MDGIRKREKLQAEGNSFRFVVCWLFVRVLAVRPFVLNKRSIGQ